MSTLPGRFADRLPTGALETVRALVEDGELRIAVDELLAVLRHYRVPVTDDERAELAKLAEAMRLPRDAGGRR